MKIIMKRLISFVLAFSMIAALTPAAGDVRAYAANPETDFVFDASTGGITDLTAEAKLKTKIEIPATIGGVAVTRLESGFLENNKVIEELIIPEGVTFLGQNMCHNATALRSVTIPESVNTVESSVFSDCTSIVSVTIPGGMENVPDIFKNCTKLETVVINEGVKQILNGAFYSCTSLRNVSLPSSITSIRSEGTYAISAFKGCNAIDNLTYNGTRTAWDKLGRGPLPNSSDPKIHCLVSEGYFLIDKSTGTITGVTTTGKEKTELVIPEIIDGVAVKGMNDVFSGNKTIKKVTIPGCIKTIEGGTFSYCPALETVVINEGVTKIKTGGFYDCTALKSVTIPASMNYMQEETYSSTAVFKGCNALEKITFGGTKTAWDNMSSRGGLPASSDPKITCLTAEGDYLFDKSTGKITGVTTTGKEKTELVIPETIDGVAVKAMNDIFFENTTIKKVTIPGCIDRIDGNTFYHCTALETVVINEGVKKIGGGAFNGCSALKNVTIPASMERIESSSYYYTDAFEGCSAIENIKYGGTRTAWDKMNRGGLPASDAGSGIAMNFLESIAVTSTDHKTVYSLGDELDVRGLTIKALMSDSTETTGIAVTSDMVSGFDSSKSSDALALTITYRTATCTYDVKIAKNAGPAAPAGLTSKDETKTGANDGIINGTASGMEYADNKEFTNAADCGTSITGLAPGTYYVRYKATATTEAGAYTEIIVKAHKHTLTEVTGKKATCTDAGVKTYYSCPCGDFFEDSNGNTVISDLETWKVIPATGHDWNATAYSWSEDGKTCTATRICANDGKHKETSKAAVTSKVTKKPTETSKGETTYTAVFTDGWAAKQTKVIADIPVIEAEKPDYIYIPSLPVKPEPEEPEEDPYAELIAGVQGTSLRAFSSLTKAGNIRIRWTKTPGYRVDYYEVYRSTKRFEGYGKVPFFTTKNSKNPEKKWYVNTKNLKKGTRYFYKVRGVRIIDGKKIYTEWSAKAFRVA